MHLIVHVVMQGGKVSPQTRTSQSVLCFCFFAVVYGFTIVCQLRIFGVARAKN